MPLGHLDNLVQIKKLKAEPPDQNEIDGMGIVQTVDTWCFNACNIPLD